MSRAEGQPLPHGLAERAFERTKMRNPHVKGLSDVVGLDEGARYSLLGRAIANAASYFENHTHPRFSAIGTSVLDAIQSQRIKLKFPDVDEKDRNAIRRHTSPSISHASQDGEPPVISVPLGFGVKALVDPIEALGQALAVFCEAEVLMNEWSITSAINQGMMDDAVRATQAEFYLMAQKETPGFRSRTADNAILRYPKGLRSFSLEGRIEDVSLESLRLLPQNPSFQ